MCMGYCGFQEVFHTRAIRDDKKTTQSEGPMTMPEISLVKRRWYTQEGPGKVS